MVSGATQNETAEGINYDAVLITLLIRSAAAAINSAYRICMGTTRAATASLCIRAQNGR
jgi:hypothetical protein